MKHTARTLSLAIPSWILPMPPFSRRKVRRKQHKLFRESHSNTCHVIIEDTAVVLVPCLYEEAHSALAGR